MPHPFKTFTPKRDPQAVLAVIRGRARTRTQVRAGLASAAGLALLVLGGLWLHSPAPSVPPPIVPGDTPVVARAWSGDEPASVIVFNINRNSSVIFIQTP
jgi:hypothetical protein